MSCSSRRATTIRLVPTSSPNTGPNPPRLVSLFAILGTSFGLFFQGSCDVLVAMLQNFSVLPGRRRAERGLPGDLLFGQVQALPARPRRPRERIVVFETEGVE